MWALDDEVPVDMRAAVPRRVLEEAESRAGEVEFGMGQEAIGSVTVGGDCYLPKVRRERRLAVQLAARVVDKRMEDDEP